MSDPVMIAEGLTAQEAKRAAASLAVRNNQLEMDGAQKDAQLAEAKGWMEVHAPKLLGRGGRVLGSVAAGGLTGVAFGLMDPVYAMAGAAVASTAAGFGILLFKKADAKDLLACVSAGIAAAAAGREAEKLTREAMRESAAKKAASGNAKKV